MAIEYVGDISMEVDGKEYDIISLKPVESTGRKIVKVMNKAKRAKGYSKGIRTFDLSVTAAIEQGEKTPWGDIEGAKITIRYDDGRRKTYRDCYSTEISEQYEVDNEARIDITMFALDCVEE